MKNKTPMHPHDLSSATCIIVDDEPLARDVIRRYIEQVPFIQLVESFGNALDASIFLMKTPVDILFLDINMPGLSGIDMLHGLSNTPKVIFTTAHKEFAFEGFELNVVDYLLKPIRFERFLRAVQKAHFTSTTPPAEIQAPKDAGLSTTDEAFIYVRCDRKMVRVALHEILYIESKKDYIQIVTLREQLITRQTITSIELMLPKKEFMRIHRSFIIALKHIRAYTSETVEIHQQELPIGKLFRKQFLELQF